MFFFFLKKKMSVSTGKGGHQARARTTHENTRRQAET